MNDTRYTVLSHMGNILKAGDTVLGYDLTTAVFSGDGDEDVGTEGLPDVVLVKKVYQRDPKKRNWKLQKLEMKKDSDAAGEGKASKERKGRDTGAEEDEAKQMEDFLQDIEEDKTLRAAINIFKGACVVHGPAWCEVCPLCVALRVAVGRLVTWWYWRWWRWC